MGLNVWAQPWYPARPKAGPPKAVEEQEVVADVKEPFPLAALPSDVVTHCISFLESPRDMASVVVAGSKLAWHVKEAEVCMNLSGKLGDAGACSAVLHSLAKYFGGVTAVLLPSSVLEDGELGGLLEALPRLQLLDVSGGRKLTQGAAEALARVNASLQQRRVSGAVAGRVLPLASVNLQRCFQMAGGSLDRLLAAPQMRVVALSHLDLGRWPAQAPDGAEEEGGTQPDAKESTLQVLALHNCLRVHGAAIQSLAASPAAPSLRYLLLGGSVLALSSFAAEEDTLPPLPPAAAARLAASYAPWPGSSSATRQAHLAAAQHVLAAALALPRLRALELSFWPPPLVAAVRRVLADPEATGRSAVEVWDFAADAGAVRRALAALQHCLGAPAAAAVDEASLTVADGPAACCVTHGSRGAELVASQSALAVLRCAVNCSSATRTTPLHAAAGERGDAAGVAVLVGSGAAVDARDTGGATPLFLACEAGHSAVAAALLAAGADPLLSNAAGESPLYIAALRGHLAVVQLLLGHLNAARICWLDPALYGDAWTPLMAAAVGNRAEVAAALLQAAGAAGAVGRFVAAVNKYGQSVMHIAARKGSSQLLQLLLSAGGVALVGARDGSGDTPVDVAKKHHHTAALTEFRRFSRAWDQGVTAVA